MKKQTREYLKIKMAIAHLLTIDIIEGERIEVYMPFATFSHIQTNTELIKGEFIKPGKGSLVKAVCLN